VDGLYSVTSFGIKTSGSVTRIFIYFYLIFLPNLKNDGVPLQACHIFEDEIDDFQILVPFQKTRIILFKIVQEVVENEVGPWNTQKTCIYY
jgi:hypothetical protein